MNENIKRGLKSTMGVVKQGCELAAGVLALVLVSAATKTTVDDLYPSNRVRYDDAVDAIMGSYMCSEDKSEAVAAMKMGMSSEYYKAIISVVESYMCSEDKVRTIQEMGLKE